MEKTDVPSTPTTNTIGQQQQPPAAPDRDSKLTTTSNTLPATTTTQTSAAISESSKTNINPKEEPTSSANNANPAKSPSPKQESTTVPPPVVTNTDKPLPQSLTTSEYTESSASSKEKESMKRPPNDPSPLSTVGEVDSDGSGGSGPKKKKLRKEAVFKASSVVAEATNTNSPKSVSGEPVPMDTTETSTEADPKVPPLKLVLQSSSEITAESGSSASSNLPVTSTGATSVSNAQSGLVYAVSSTTSATAAEGGPVIVDADKTSIGSASKDDKDSEFGISSSEVKEKDKEKEISGSAGDQREGSGSGSDSIKDDKSVGGEKSPQSVGDEKEQQQGSGPTANAGGTASNITGAGSTKDHKPHRVTRSSQRIAVTGGTTATPNSPSTGPTGNSPKGTTNSNCPSPSNLNEQNESPANNVQSNVEESSVSIAPTSSAPAANSTAPTTIGVHPRKRKIKPKETPSAGSSTSSSVSGEANEAGANPSGAQSSDPPLLNCYEMFLNIRKQIDRRRKSLFPVQPKPPQGFKDYLMNRGTYVLASTANAHLAVPSNSVPNNLHPQLKELFIDQEKERHKLRMQQVVEKEKLVLSVEQEILRVHGRAARALSNQALPFSVCTILKDEEIYNLLTPEQEEKDRNARSRYNGRLFLSWLQDVDDKWDKIKESMLLRHHNEAESLHAVQKMDWEWKLKEVGLCEPKGNPSIDELHVPMVHVSDDFDLLPA